MTVMMVRWYRSRRNLAIIVIAILCLLYYVCVQDSLPREDNLDITRSNGVGSNSSLLAPVVSKLALTKKQPLLNANSNGVGLNSSSLAPVVSILALTKKQPLLNTSRANIITFIESKLEEALIEDKGTGCEFPQLDPFSPEMTQFDKDPKPINCQGEDWVKCHLSECRVKKSLLKNFNSIDCDYKDIIYHNDAKYTIGQPTTVHGGAPYTLTRSDHVKITCVGLKKGELLSKKWVGHGIGFRKNVERKKPPPGREDSIDVLIFGFDSTSRNTFIRRMPKSWKYLTEDLGATVLYGYNIVGDGTPAALFPILTGKTELELPDVRKKSTLKASLDDMPFIFYKLKEDGYRTAYFEDMPWVGTFQYRFKGFKRQPADHYLRAFYLEESQRGRRWSSAGKYCVGDTPQFQLMMNITEQFLSLEGKHFAFTFIADITHDDQNTIALADSRTRAFLQNLHRSGVTQNTLLIVMGDHGPRFANTRNTLQGKFEERQPLMAVRVPEVLREKRPEIDAILKGNSRDVLTTPHDIYATVLDAIGMEEHWNDYKIKGADLTRGLTLFQPIPHNRSCSEAGVESHWCACVAWDAVPLSDAVTDRVAHAFVDFINQLSESVRSRCVPRTLTSTSSLHRRRESARMLQFQSNRDADGYLGKFNDHFKTNKVFYQIKLEVGPGVGIYEASTTYMKDEDKFIFDTRDISRINPYNDEPSCISATHPHLNPYCYCHKP